MSTAIDIPDDLLVSLVEALDRPDEAPAPAQKAPETPKPVIETGLKEDAPQGKVEALTKAGVPVADTIEQLVEMVRGQAAA